MVDNGRERTVFFETGDAPARMLTGQETTDEIESVAIGISAGLAERSEPSGDGPALEFIVRDIAEDERSASRIPDRSLNEAQVGSEFVDDEIWGCAARELGGLVDGDGIDRVNWGRSCEQSERREGGE